MTSRIIHLLVAIVAALVFSTSAYAGCTNAQFAGTWEMVFSDGNSCELVVNRVGDVVADESICFDPFRGATEPDSGALIVAEDCSVSGTLVVEGAPVSLAGRIARGRDSGAGRYQVLEFVKGSFTMIRMP